MTGGDGKIQEGIMVQDGGVATQDEALLVPPLVWIRLPERFGGKKVGIRESFWTLCVCGHDHTVQHWALATDPPLYVARCTIHAFIWYERQYDPEYDLKTGVEE